MQLADDYLEAMLCQSWAGGLSPQSSLGHRTDVLITYVNDT